MDHNKLESNSTLLTNSQLSPLITKIMEMIKKPSIEAELGKTLHDFMHKLNQCEKGSNTGSLMNFAEIALFIQGSADLYSKKVDILWDFILDYQQRMMLKEKNINETESELEKLEERKRKYKRKRKTNINNSEISTIVDQYSFGSAENDDYLNHTYHKHNLLEKWQNFNMPQQSQCTPTELPSNYALFLPDDAIYTEERDYTGRYNQFHSISCLSQGLERPFSCLNSPGVNIPSYVKEKRSVSSCSKRLSFNSDCLNNNFTRELYVSLEPLAPELVKNYSTSESALEMCSKFHSKSYVHLERLPMDLVQKKLRRLSVADSAFDENDNFDDEIDDNDDISAPIEHRNKSCSQESGFFDVEECDNKSILSNINVNRSIIVPNSKTIKLRDHIVDKLESTLKVKSKRKKRINAKLIERLCKGVTVNFIEFENFLRMHYKPAEGEGKIVQKTPICPEPDSDDESMMDFAENIAEMSTPISRRDPSCEIEQPFEEVYEEREEIEETQQNTVSNSEFQQQDESRRIVSEWRSSILPKIRDANKSTFDIHEYGSKILDEFNVGEQKLFKDLVKRKGSREMNRFFMAALQLINSGNIEISGVQPGQIANETFQIKVIDKQRHHEELIEYEAPSEECSRLNRNNSYSKTSSSGEPPKKKKRFV